jgi:NADH:ubiquinone oxidoreductase subunit 6 (subunit J)
MFGSLALMSAVKVIRARNPVHSVLYLVLVFCNAAGLLLLLEVEFLGMIFLVVYVGAIAVLFLFVVMMLAPRVDNTGKSGVAGKNEWREGLLGVEACLLFIIGNEAQSDVNLSEKMWHMSDKATGNESVKEWVGEMDGEGVTNLESIL